MAAILRDSTVVAVAVTVAVAVLCGRQRAILLAMITMRKSLYKFPLIPYMVMGSVWGPFGRRSSAKIVRYYTRSDWSV